MKLLKTLPAAAFVLCINALPSQASSLDDILRLLIKSIPAPSSTPTPSAPARKWPTVGLRSADKAISALPEAARPSPQHISDAYLTLLARAGVTTSLMTSCPSCILATPRLPDESLRAAKLTLENDLFLAGQAAGNTTTGALATFHPRTGKQLMSPPVTQRQGRPEVIAALAEAMGGLRDGALAETEFADALAANLRKLAEEPKPKSRFGLEDISYDADKRMLTFKVRYRNTTAKIANLDIRSYVDRLTGLVFGAGGIYLMQPDTDTPAAPPAADAATLAVAKTQKANALVQARTKACEPTPSPACFTGQMDLETSQQLHEAVWSEALLELLGATGK